MFLFITYSNYLILKVLIIDFIIINVYSGDVISIRPIREPTRHLRETDSQFQLRVEENDRHRSITLSRIDNNSNINDCIDNKGSEMNERHAYRTNDVNVNKDSINWGSPSSVSPKKSPKPNTVNFINIF